MQQAGDADSERPWREEAGRPRGPPRPPGDTPATAAAAPSGAYRDPHQGRSVPDRLAACQAMWDHAESERLDHRRLRAHVTQALADIGEATGRYAALAGLTMMPGVGKTDAMQELLDTAEHARDDDLAQHERMRARWDGRAADMGPRPEGSATASEEAALAAHVHWWRDERLRAEPIMRAKLTRSREHYDMVAGHIGPPLVFASDSPIFCGCAAAATIT